MRMDDSSAGGGGVLSQAGLLDTPTLTDHPIRPNPTTTDEARGREEGIRAAEEEVGRAQGALPGHHEGDRAHQEPHGRPGKAKHARAHARMHTISPCLTLTLVLTLTLILCSALLCAVHPLTPQPSCQPRIHPKSPLPPRPPPPGLERLLLADAGAVRGGRLPAAGPAGLADGVGARAHAHGQRGGREAARVPAVRDPERGEEQGGPRPAGPGAGRAADQGVQGEVLRLPHQPGQARLSPDVLHHARRGAQGGWVAGFPWTTALTAEGWLAGVCLID